MRKRKQGYFSFDENYICIAQYNHSDMCMYYDVKRNRKKNRGKRPYSKHIRGAIAKEDIEEYYLQALKLEPKLLIDYLIKEIRLYDDKIEITFNSPIKISPDNNQGFFIAEYSSKMRQIIQNKTIPNYIDIKVKIYV